MSRLHALVEAARAATQYELTKAAGRDAIVLTTPEGKRTSFLTPAERTELETLLTAPPAQLTHPGLPTCTWNLARRTAQGVDAQEFVTLVVYDGTPKEATTRVLDTVAATYRRVLDRRDEILADVAAQATPLYNDVWRSGPKLKRAQVAERLRLDAVTISFVVPEEATASFDDGQLFAGHRLRVRVDEDGSVGECEL